MSAMRSGRVNLPNRCYHLISRVAHRAFFLDEGERAWLVGLIRRVARFSGVDVLAYSVMSNHFHLFVYIGYPEPLGDAEIVRRIAALYSDVRFELVMKKWNELAREPGSSAFRRYRESFLRRMWSASEFMKTLKQHYTMSFNGRRGHHGTMWESRYRVRVKDPGEFGVMMAESGYVDANPVNARLVDWPDKYEWCSYAAACAGDETARAGYDFVYGGKGRSWPELRSLHDVSIRHMLREREWRDSEDLELARTNRRPDRRGKCYAAGLETPGYVPQVVEVGDNVLAVRLMQLLQWEPKPPAYLRTTLGIASREYFTKAYLRPLTETGLIARTDPDHPNSPRQKYALTAEGRNRIGRAAPL